MAWWPKIVCLGDSCRAGFQARRFAKAQLGCKWCVPSVFDRQITPHRAMLEYFRNDFRGMFELNDFDDITGPSPRNLRFKTKHPHEFCNGYEAARRTHDELCASVRRVIHGRSPVLFVVGTRTDTEWPMAFDETIRTINPRLPFDVCIVRDDTPGKQPTWKGDDAIWDAALGSVSELRSVRPIQRQAVRLADHIRRTFQ